MLALSDCNTFATDMTFVLGAESYIVRNGFPRDPSANKCLQDFIDLFLNAKDMYFTLPDDQDKGTPILIQRLSNHLHKLSRGNIELSPQTEKKLLTHFMKLIERECASTLQEQTWLQRWVSFQILNPIVTEGHKYRVSKKGEKMISQSGYQIWQQYREKISKKRLLQKVNLAPHRRYLEELMKYVKPELATFSSLDEFLMCYAFDVYRRGWQYMEAVRVSGEAVGVEATYFPHKLRNDALCVATNKWTEVSDCQEILWSWGGYIVQLLDEPGYEREQEPERVVDHVLAIRDAIKKNRESIPPRWEHTYNIFD